MYLLKYPLDLELRELINQSYKEKAVLERAAFLLERTVANVHAFQNFFGFVGLF